MNQNVGLLTQVVRKGAEKRVQIGEEDKGKVEFENGEINKFEYQIWNEIPLLKSSPPTKNEYVGLALRIFDSIWHSKKQIVRLEKKLYIPTNICIEN